MQLPLNLSRYLGYHSLLMKKQRAVSKHQYLALAKKQLEKVQSAWTEPTDWDDLTMYGFYCLENAVAAAALHAGITFIKTHPGKAHAARELAKLHKLSDMSELLVQLNDARKAHAYGDIEEPDLIAEDVAATVEEVVNSVESFLDKTI